MEWISKSNILIVGLGLIGGSYARALKHLGYHIFAIDAKQSSMTAAFPMWTRTAFPARTR
ncbi:MAG: hypothetical protein LUC40_01620 [Oscillospiraceae bacterium]|nr:hypothetical protein [Oscillospiraceae bacterium]